jgi:hypothetical protein
VLIGGDCTLEVSGTANKYVVASYAPGLVTAPDGSVSIVMAVNKPKEVPQANWLPATYSQWPIQPHASRLRA